MNTPEQEQEFVMALKAEKQRQFDQMVEGNGNQPAEVVDSVVYRIADFLRPTLRRRLIDEVIMFYPDYSKDY